VQITKKL